jgi:uncharacterized protein YxjI
MTPVDPNEHDLFVLSQRWAPVINRYEFTLPTEDGEPVQPVCFVEQKRFKFKEDIRFFADDTARQRFDPAARYDITGAQGVKIGELQKVFGASLLRSTYKLYDPSGEETAKATEKSLLVAVFRRLVGFIPFVEYVADWVPIPYHFVFKRGDQVLAANHRRAWKFRDTDTIDLTGDPGRTLDRRLVLATAVGMDALQAR